MFKKSSPAALGIWIYTPAPAHELAQTDGDWTRIPQYDIAGEGDVGTIVNWSINNTLDQLKAKVIENNWSGFVLGMAGTDAADTCWFKKVDYKLVPGRTGVNMFVDSFYIYSKYHPSKSN